jgi:hypothetical protein
LTPRHVVSPHAHERLATSATVRRRARYRLARARPESRKRAESGPKRIASGRAAIRAIAIVRLQAQNRLYRAPGAHSSEPSRQSASSLGSFAGVSKRTVEKIAAVVKAADVDREKFGHLVEEMDRTGSRAAGRRGQTFRSERLKLPDIGNVWGLAFAAAAPAGSTARSRGFFRAAFAPARTFAVGPGAAAAGTTPTAGRDLRPPLATPVSLPW